jgi:hypothetical protein
MPTTAAAMPAERSPSPISGCERRLRGCRRSASRGVAFEHDDHEVLNAARQGPGDRREVLFTGASRLTWSFELGPTTSFSM